MHKLLLHLFLLFSLSCFSQSSNLILLVNGKLITFGFGNAYLEFKSQDGVEKISVEYLPGDLKITNEAWSMINNLYKEKFTLYIDYTTYQKGKTETKKFEIELSKYLVNQKYLVADIYDFRNRKYKKWYQYITEKDHLVQFHYRPQNGVHGIYVRRK